MNIYKKCCLCPKNCMVNRYTQVGYCGCTNKIKIAYADLFFYEEPPISGTKGSGTIFFTGCNLKCCFCQNIEISRFNKGQTITINKLSDIMLKLQNKGAHNINLVTPTMYVPSIIKAIKIAKRKGLNIPIIYNCSGYENVNTIKLLNGYIDIYLPDFKYYDNFYAKKYSKVNDYVQNVKASLNEMIKQQGTCLFDNRGIIKKGVIVRHLMLPSLKDDTKKILKYLYQTYHNNIYLSIMNQYTPNKYVKFKELKETLNKKDYDDMIIYAMNLGITNAFCQLDGTISESFIPEFKEKVDY